jgi:hypothetical protein
MQTKTYEVVTVPGEALETMAELIEDAYIEANIEGGQVVAVHSFQQGLVVVVEYPLEKDPSPPRDRARYALASV